MHPKPLPETRRRASESLDRLVEMMATLRAPDGCPWDQEQTFDSLKPYLIEEAYEVLDAMEEGSEREHCEELGDLLFQIVFHAEIAREKGAWDLADVIDAIADKIESRHPHVFAGVALEEGVSIDDHWVRIKAAEKASKKGRRVSVIDGVPRQAPALLRAERITEKASRIGFDWPDVQGVRAKVGEELAELDEAIASRDPAAIEHELGDLLFAVANLARHVGSPAEDALRGAIRRFETRFAHVEEGLHEKGLATGERAPLEWMDALWDEAKRIEKAGK